MKNKELRFDDNAPGKYYVDKDCTGCGLCTNDAPENFKMSDDQNHAVVFKQPGSADEEKACHTALEDCPVEAIGDNG